MRGIGVRALVGAPVARWHDRNLTVPGRGRSAPVATMGAYAGTGSVVGVSSGDTYTVNPGDLIVAICGSYNSGGAVTFSAAQPSAAGLTFTLIGKHDVDNLVIGAWWARSPDSTPRSVYFRTVSAASPHIGLLIVSNVRPGAEVASTPYAGAYSSTQHPVIPGVAAPMGPALAVCGVSSRDDNRMRLHATGMANGWKDRLSLWSPTTATSLGIAVKTLEGGDHGAVSGDCHYTGNGADAGAGVLFVLNAGP